MVNFEKKKVEKKNKRILNSISRAKMQASLIQAIIYLFFHNSIIRLIFQSNRVLHANAN
jgi:hypothetical protein